MHCWLYPSKTYYFIAMNKQKIGCALDYRMFFKITNFEIRNTNLQNRGKQVCKLAVLFYLEHCNTVTRLV